MIHKSAKVEVDMPPVNDIHADPLAKFIEFAANDSEYCGRKSKLKVNWALLLFQCLEGVA